MIPRDERRRGEYVFGKFLLASLPGWLIALIVAVALARMTHVPLTTTLVLLAIWVAIDLVTFPRRRRYYVSEPSAERIVGERGVAVSALSPRGFVRVHGELWQARTGDGATLHEGDELVVRDIHGLELVVERMRR